LLYTGLVGRQESEVVWRVGDDVSLGVRVGGDRACEVAEPVDADAQDAELAQRVHEQLAVRTVQLHTDTQSACLGSCAMGQTDGRIARAARRYAPADSSSARGESTSVRGRVRSLHICGGRRWLSCRQPACL